MVMKILLINPWTSESFRSQTTVPPLGILYIGAVLRDRYELKFIDMDADHYTAKEFEFILANFKPDIAGITCNILQVPEVFRIASQIKTARPRTVTIVGGPAPSAQPVEILSSCESVDIAVIGEGEETILELLNLVETKDDLSIVKGIAYRDISRGQILRTPPRSYIDNLETLPFPAHHLNMPMSRYKCYPMAAVISSRGCPFRCLFCSNPVWRRTNRRRSVENVLKEINWLVEDFGVKEVDFHDDTFNLNTKFVEDLCDRLIETQLHKTISWRAECRVDNQLISEPLLMRMKESGCWLISFGIESGNSKILGDAKKGISLQEVEEAVKLCKKVGISTRGFFMIGHIGENYETAFDTILFAQKLNQRINQFHLLTPYPGSGYYEIAKKNGWIEENDYGKYDGYSAATIRTERLQPITLQGLRDFAEFKNPSRWRVAPAPDMIRFILRRVFAFLYRGWSLCKLMEKYRWKLIKIHIAYYYYKIRYFIRLF